MYGSVIFVYKTRYKSSSVQFYSRVLDSHKNRYVLQLQLVIELEREFCCNDNSKKRKDSSRKIQWEIIANNVEWMV